MEPRTREAHAGTGPGARAYEVRFSTKAGESEDAFLTVSDDGTAALTIGWTTHKGTFDKNTGKAVFESEGDSPKIIHTVTLALENGSYRISQFEVSKQWQGPPAALDVEKSSYSAEGLVVSFEHSWTNPSTAGTTTTTYTYEGSRLVRERSNGSTQIFENGRWRPYITHVREKFYRYGADGKRDGTIDVKRDTVRGSDGVVKVQAEAGYEVKAGDTLVKAREYGTDLFGIVVSFDDLDLIDQEAHSKRVVHFEDGSEMFTVEYGKDADGFFVPRLVIVPTRFPELILFGAPAMTIAPSQFFSETFYLVRGELDARWGGTGQDVADEDVPFRQGQVLSSSPMTNLFFGETYEGGVYGKFLGYGLSITRFSFEGNTWKSETALIEAFPQETDFTLAGKPYRAYLDPSGKVWILDARAAFTQVFSTSAEGDRNVALSLFADGRAEIIYNGFAYEGAWDPATGKVVFEVSTPWHLGDELTFTLDATGTSPQSVSRLDIEHRDYAGNVTSREGLTFDTNGLVTLITSRSDSYESESTYEYVEAGGRWRVSRSKLRARYVRVYGDGERVTTSLQKAFFVYDAHGRKTLESYAAKTVTDGNTWVSSWYAAYDYASRFTESASANVDFTDLDVLTKADIDAAAYVKNRQYYRGDNRFGGFKSFPFDGLRFTVEYAKDASGAFVPRKLSEPSRWHWGNRGIGAPSIWPGFAGNVWIIVGIPDELDPNGLKDDIAFAEGQRVTGLEDVFARFGAVWETDAQGKFVFAGYGLQLFSWKAGEDGKFTLVSSWTDFPASRQIQWGNERFSVEIRDGLVKLALVRRTLPNGAEQYFDAKGRLIRFVWNDARGREIVFSYEGDSTEPKSAVLIYRAPGETDPSSVRIDFAAGTAEAEYADGRIFDYDLADSEVIGAEELADWIDGTGAPRSVWGVLGRVRFPNGLQMGAASLKNLADSLGVNVRDIMVRRIQSLPAPAGVGNAVRIAVDGHIRSTVLFRDPSQAYFTAVMDGATVQLDRRGNIVFSVVHLIRTGLGITNLLEIADRIGYTIFDLATIDTTSLPVPSGIGNALRMGANLTLTDGQPYLLILDTSTTSMERGGFLLWGVTRVYRTSMRARTLQSVADALGLDGVTQIRSVRALVVAPPPGVGNAVRFMAIVNTLESSGERREYVVTGDGSTMSLDEHDNVIFFVNGTTETNLGVRTLENIAAWTGIDATRFVRITTQTLSQTGGRRVLRAEALLKDGSTMSFLLSGLTSDRDEHGKVIYHPEKWALLMGGLPGGSGGGRVQSAVAFLKPAAMSFAKVVKKSRRDDLALI